MKVSKAGVWLSIASALLVVGFVVWDSRQASPGPISAVHGGPGGIAEDDCKVCHGGFGQSLRSACAECHADVERQVARAQGFHGQLADAARCGACHGEHHGAEFELVGAAAFAQAGVAARDAYRHEGLRFDLAGKHAGLACKACHENADVPLLAKGQKRFLGKSQDCASCHEDPHEGRLPDCRSCHGESEPFRRVATFRHPESFALSGAHAKPGCLDCHPKGTPHAVEASGPAGTTKPARACQDCHASPHAAPFVQAITARLAVAAGASCASCHPVEGGPFATPRALSPEEHALSGFTLDKPHDQVACAKCHAKLATPAHGEAALAAFRAAYPGRSPDACEACHADPHGGQFRDGRWAGKGCIACHERLRFDPPRFGVPEHAETAFALTGKHADAACAGCHAKAHAGEPRRFRGTASACAACHADAHRGFFAAAARPELAARAGDCAECHGTASFAEVPAQRFDHAAWTGFALEGKHQDARCESCHAAAAQRDETGRAFGRVVTQGPPQACGSCHADAHRGFFARAPGAVAHAGQDCAQCHTARGFSPVAPERFDHARATGFALEGAHLRAACTTCHPRSAQPDERGRTLGFAADRLHGSFQDCRTCHADPHGGEFDRPGRPVALEGRTGCLRCHTQETFREVEPARFDHAQWTGFALDGAHARARCESCHAVSAQPDAQGRRFGRAHGGRCTDCHADPHVGQFADKGRTDCARCHSAASDFLSVRFDHQRDSRFPLDASHVPWPLPGGGSAVRYKPLGTTCGDCHDPRAAPRGPQARDEGLPR
jgi:hypothetical protein